MQVLTKISQFTGEYEFLSNFYPCNGFRGPTLEHEFQAAKFKDVTIVTEILAAAKPSEAKKIARKPEYKEKIRPGWEMSRVFVMHRLLVVKFSPTANKQLAKKLVLTKDTLLEEGNYWKDDFWGVYPPGSNNGFNMLGKLLMDVREQLIRNSAYVDYARKLANTKPIEQV